MEKNTNSHCDVAQDYRPKIAFICDPSKHVFCEKPCLGIKDYFCRNTANPQFAKTDEAGRPIVSPDCYSYMRNLKNNLQIEPCQSKVAGNDGRIKEV